MTARMGLIAGQMSVYLFPNIFTINRLRTACIILYRFLDNREDEHVTVLRETSNTHTFCATRMRTKRWVPNTREWRENYTPNSFIHFALLRASKMLRYQDAKPKMFNDPKGVSNPVAQDHPF